MRDWAHVECEGMHVRDLSRTLKRSDGGCIKIVNLEEHGVRGMR